VLASTTVRTSRGASASPSHHGDTDTFLIGLLPSRKGGFQGGLDDDVVDVTDRGLAAGELSVLDDGPTCSSTSQPPTAVR
jgi:hypothetical protein